MAMPSVWLHFLVCLSAPEAAEELPQLGLDLDAIQSHVVFQVRQTYAVTMAGTKAPLSTCGQASRSVVSEWMQADAVEIVPICYCVQVGRR